MAEINSVALVARLTRDAELKYTNGGTAVVKFSLASNRRKKTGDTWTDEVSFFDVTMMGKGPEAVHKYLTKGKMVGVQGELRQNRWEQDGQTRSKVEVFAFTIQLLGGTQGNSQGRSDASQGGGQPGGRPDFNAIKDPVERQKAIDAWLDQGQSVSGDQEYTDDIPF